MFIQGIVNCFTNAEGTKNTYLLKRAVKILNTLFIFYFVVRIEIIKNKIIIYVKGFYSENVYMLNELFILFYRFGKNAVKFFFCRFNNRQVRFSVFKVGKTFIRKDLHFIVIFSRRFDGID